MEESTGEKFNDLGNCVIILLSQETYFSLRAEIQDSILTFVRAATMQITPGIYASLSEQSGQHNG